MSSSSVMELKTKLIPVQMKHLLHSLLLRQDKLKAGLIDEVQLYEEEYRALCEEAEDEKADFCSRRITVPNKYRRLIDDVTAVDRLTEVVAMAGFTRLQSWDGKMGSPCLAPIFSYGPKPWLPAIDMHGEGIFIKFNEDKIAEWETRNMSIYLPMMKKVEENHFHCENASPRYVLLHTFSHLFIRSLAKLCGYQASSLKERIYSTYEGGEAAFRIGFPSFHLWI